MDSRTTSLQTEKLEYIQARFEGTSREELLQKRMAAIAYRIDEIHKEVAAEVEKKLHLMEKGASSVFSTAKEQLDNIEKGASDLKEANLSIKEKINEENKRLFLLSQEKKKLIASLKALQSRLKNPPPPLLEGTALELSRRMCICVAGGTPK